MIGMPSISEPLARETAALLDDSNLFSRNGLTADPFQSEILSFDGRGLLVCCARQTGKSTAVAALAGQHALRTDEATILMAAPSERQARELLRGVKRLLRGASYTDEIVNDGVMSLELRNGARIIALSAAALDGVRGYSDISLLVADEAAFIPREFFAVIAPMIAVSARARFVCLSTPNGRDNWFSDRWHDGSNGWTRISWRAEQCPRIKTEFLAAQRRELGERLFKQEYLCECVTEGDAPAFDLELIQNSIRPMGTLMLHA